MDENTVNMTHADGRQVTVSSKVARFLSRDDARWTTEGQDPKAQDRPQAAQDAPGGPDGDPHHLHGTPPQIAAQEVTNEAKADRDGPEPQADQADTDQADQADTDQADQADTDQADLDNLAEAKAMVESDQVQPTRIPRRTKG